MPWVRYEAENGQGNATVVGPSREVGTIAGEALGRKAVVLDATGEYVQWTVGDGYSNAGVVIRFCIPDAPGGGGIDATLSLYVNGQHRTDFQLTSKHAWLYGDEANPVNDPNAGSPRRIYDETRAIIGSVPAGAVIKVQKDSGDTASYYAVDFIEIEEVPEPVGRPAGYISILDYGAVPNDTSDDSNAIQQAIWAASQQGTGVYIPPGVYYQYNKLMGADNVTVQGAGVWHTVIYDPTGSAGDWGNVGFNLNFADNFKVYDLAIFGSGTIRDTGGKAFCNSPGAGFEVRNLWIEHVNCGFWLGSPQPTVGAYIRDVRIRNTYADGLNLCNSTRDTIVENSTARYTGDDAFAMWSARDLSADPDRNNVFRYLTAEMPWRANAFAVYGGENNKIQNCVAVDTLTYAGVNISSCFNPYPFAGTTLVEEVTLIRCGGAFWGGLQFGALWINVDDLPIPGLVVRNVDIIDSTFSGLHIQSETYNQNPVYDLQNGLFENISITGSGTDGIYVRAGSRGSATFNYVSVSGSAGSALRNDASDTFTIIRGPGNEGW